MFFIEPQPLRAAEPTVRRPSGQGMYPQLSSVFLQPGSGNRRASDNLQHLHRVICSVVTFFISSFVLVVRFARTLVRLHNLVACVSISGSTQVCTCLPCHISPSEGLTEKRNRLQKCPACFGEKAYVVLAEPVCDSACRVICTGGSGDCLCGGHQ